MNISKEQEIEIIQKYQNGILSSVICKEYGIHISSVSNVLKRNGISARKGKPKTCNIDENCFSSIDSIGKAYWLGIMFSDGNVGKNSIQIDMLDKDCIEKFHAFMKSTHKILVRNTKEGKIKYGLRISNKKIVSDLKTHGCVERKSLILQWPTSVPEHLYSHFIRGYMDGDGSINYSFASKTSKYKRWNLQFLGTHEFLLTLKNYFDTLGIKSNLKPHRSIYELRIRGNKQIRSAWILSIKIVFKMFVLIENTKNIKNLFLIIHSICKGRCAIGCDIHVYFDEMRNGKWDLPFQPTLEPEWWWESILDAKAASGAACVITGKVDDNEAYEALKKMLKEMPLEKATKEFLYDPAAYREWNLPEGENYWDRIDSRDYDWFTALGGVRNYDDEAGAFSGRGFPKDAHPLIRCEYVRWNADGHSHSWAMVDDIINHPRLQQFRQVEWLRRHIRHPENTRMIFWFDN